MALEIRPQLSGQARALGLRTKLLGASAEPPPHAPAPAPRPRPQLCKSVRKSTWHPVRCHCCRPREHQAAIRHRAGLSCVLARARPGTLCSEQC